MFESTTTAAAPNTTTGAAVAAAVAAAAAKPANSTNQTTPYQIIKEGSDMSSIVNVTREYPLDYAVVMFGYLLPVVLFVTIVTNLLVVAVLYQRHMRTPTNIVLFTMAIVDLATLLSPSPWYLYIYTFGNYNEYLYPPIACYAHHIMTDVVPVFFHTSSIWLALLLASQRYIYVCHPTLARTWCTVPRVKRAILVILITAFLHQVSRFFDNSFIPVLLELKHANHMACRNEIAKWVHSVDVAFYYTTYFTFRILFVFIIPCSALITLNWLLFRALKQAETKRTQLLKTKFKIVGVDPSHADRMNSHHNFSAAAFGLASGARNVSSYMAPETGLLGSRTSANMQSRIVPHKELVDASEPDDNGDDDDDGDGGEEEGEEDEEGGDDDEEEEQLNLNGQSGGSRLDSEKLNGLNRTSHCPPNKGPPSGNPEQAIHESRLAWDNRRTLGGATTQPAGDTKDGKMPATGDRAKQAERDGSVVGRGSAHSESSISSNTNSASSTTSKTDDLSTCPDCAAYEARGGCRGCSVTSETEVGIESSGNVPTASGCENQRRLSTYQSHLLNQQISQCSSILGGATSTTTNEDISSCQVTQNISSSVFVANTADGIETSSMHCADGAHDELSIDCEPGEDNHQHHHRHQYTHRNTHCRHNAGRPRPDENENGHVCRQGRSKRTLRLAQCRTDSDLGQLTKSGSVDSRLTCGCLSSRAIALRRVRSLGKQRRELAEGRKRISNNSKAQERHSCSALTGATQDAGQQPTEGLLGGQSTARRSQARMSNDLRSAPNRTTLVALLSGTETPEQANIDSSGSLLHAGYHSIGSSGQRVSERLSEAGELADHLSRLDMRSANVVGSFQPATTTTTIYSANTSSVGSLLVGQQSGIGDGGADDISTAGKQPRVDQIERQNMGSAKARDHLPTGAGSRAVLPALQRLKSPSFAHATGRGSRATLMGVPVPSMVVSGQTSTASNSIQATVPVSARSMDSNRTTLMLVVVVTVFLFVEVPVALMTIAHVVLNTFDVFKEVEFTHWLDYIKLFTNFMIMISYSVNFTIYCSMSKRFRETFRDLFHCGRKSARKRTKRIFSQSQAPHCTQLNAHHFAASTMVTSNINNNNNNSNNHRLGGSYQSTRPSKQHGDSGIVASNSRQNLLVGHVPRLGDRQQSECEL